MTTPGDQHNPTVVEVADLLPLALEGLADADQFSRLNQLLNDHPEARLYYLQYMELHADLGGPSDLFVATETCDLAPDVFSEVIDDALKARQRSELETQARQQLEQNLKHEQQQATITSVQRGKLQIIIPVWAVVGSAAAAAALITLGVLTFLQIDKPHQQQTAQQQIQDVPAPSQHEPTVATLTALSPDAQWAQADIALDDRLTPSQQLTLEEGFAEITTMDGAVAILEAPTRIELIDSPNALRLISGKLIGICETESSKGFLVRTPLIDVTDIGTRFGIHAAETGSVEVHVYQGETKVSRHTDPEGDRSWSERLLGGDALRTTGDGDEPERLVADQSLFETTASNVVRLPGTGQDLKPGQPDRNSQITSIDGQPLEQPHTPAVHDGHEYASWPAADPKTSQWLSWKLNLQRPVNGQNTYMFQTHIKVPDSVDLDQTHLAVRYIADNHLVAVHVNGERLTIKPADASTNERVFRDLVVKENLVTGRNRIAFEVVNRWPEENKSNPVGFRMEWELLEQKPTVDGDWRARVFKTQPTNN